MGTFIIALRMSLATLVLCGLVYPLAVTGLARVLFRHEAAGSLVTDDRGRVVGSELIAQPFTAPGYFHPRPSAAGEKGWDPLASGGSNLGPTSAKLKDRLAAERARLLGENPEGGGAPPRDLLTASASGLDPHVSLPAALWQVPRVAKARGIAAPRIAEAVQQQVEGRGLGFLGEPRVNVLTLNLALDRQFGRAGR